MRKTIFAGLVVASLIGFTGCNKSTEATSPGGGTLTLKGPSGTVDLKQGDNTTKEITIEEKNLKEDIELSETVEPAGKGVKAELDPKTVKAGGVKKTSLKITTTKEAADGDYVITVKGKSKGAETSVNVKVKVKK